MFAVAKQKVMEWKEVRWRLPSALFIHSVCTVRVLFKAFRTVVCSNMMLFDEFHFKKL